MGTATWMHLFWATSSSSYFTLWVHNSGCSGLTPGNVTASLTSQFPMRLWHTVQTLLACPPIPTPTTLRWPLLPNASLDYSNDLNVPVNSVKAVMRNLLQTLKFRYDHDSPLLNSTWWFVFPLSNVYALRHDIKDLYCCSLSPFGISPSTPLGTQTWTPHLHNFTPSPICKTLLWIPSDPQNAQLKCQ